MLHLSSTIQKCFSLILGGMLITSCNTVSQNNTTGCENDEKERIILFDGKDASAWRGFQKEELPSGWTVKDGLLITSGQGGDLGGDIITKAVFEDFHLSLEWNISEGGNSGVFFSVIENGYPTVYATGPEYQLIDDIGFEYPLEEWQQTGANYAMHNADSSKKIIKPAGEWNLSEIKVKNGHVIHWLNGEKILWNEKDVPVMRLRD